MKKVRFLTTLILLIFCASLGAQIKQNSRYQEYIHKYKDLAIKQMLHYNIPASITLAQGLLESNAGLSRLATKGNNHFGIKCHDWTGKTIHADDDAPNECFRAYKSASESYEDHSKFLTQHSRYRKLFSLKRKDYKGWAKGLKACGYATSPTYAKNLIEIIEVYKLYRYDSASKYDKKNTDFDKHKGKHVEINEHYLYPYNKNYRIKVREGDTFKSLAKETGVSYRDLAKYNERDKKDQLIEGEYIYLKKKQTKADKSYKKRPHIVKAGESMYSIAQEYGIQLKSLYKINHLSPDYSIKVGDKLYVR